MPAGWVSAGAAVYGALNRPGGSSGTSQQILNDEAQGAQKYQIRNAQNIESAQLGTGGLNQLMSDGLQNQQNVYNNPNYNLGFNQMTQQGSNILGQGVAGNGFQGFGANPYTQASANAMTDQAARLYNQTVAPTIDSQAQMAGGYGGSRNAIVQGQALGQINSGLQSGLANLYNNAYQQDQNFYSNQRAQDLQGQALGSSLYSQGIQGQLSQGSGLYNLGLTQQNAPWNVMNNATNVMTPWSGLGASTVTTQTPYSNPLANGLGAGLAGYQFAKNLGLGTGQTSQAPAYNGQLAAANDTSGLDAAWANYTPSPQ